MGLARHGGETEASGEQLNGMLEASTSLTSLNYVALPDVI